MGRLGTRFPASDPGRPVPTPDPKVTFGASPEIHFRPCCNGRHDNRRLYRAKGSTLSRLFPSTATMAFAFRVWDRAAAAVEASGGATVALRPHLRRVQYARFTGDRRQSQGAVGFVLIRRGP